MPKIEITLWHGCSPVNLLHILKTPFLENTSRRLFLHLVVRSFKLNILTMCVIFVKVTAIMGI